MYLLFNAAVVIGTLVTLGLIAVMLHRRSGAILATLLQGSGVSLQVGREGPARTAFA